MIWSNRNGINPLLYDLLFYISDKNPKIVKYVWLDMVYGINFSNYYLIFELLLHYAYAK